MDEMGRRRQWYEQYIERIERLSEPRVNIHSRVVCPCCGYPTLSAQAEFEICTLCEWEDDGQDDPHADEVWGGPNGAYSLSAARQNFQRYLSKYQPDDIPAGLRLTEIVLQAKRSILNCFEAMRQENSSSATEELWDKIRSNEEIIRRVRDPKRSEFWRKRQMLEQDRERTGTATARRGRIDDLAAGIRKLLGKR